MVIYLIPATIIVFGSSIAYIINQARLKTVEDTEQIAKNAAEKYANNLKAKLDVDFNISRGLSYALSNFNDLSNQERTKLYDRILKDATVANPHYLSFWLSMQLNYIDQNFAGKDGRARYTYYRNKSGTIIYKRDTLDLVKSEINEQSAYQVIRRSKQESIIDPYAFSYTGREADQILETSVCVPIIVNGEFAGLVGADLELDTYKSIISKMDIYGGGNAFFISNNGTIIAYPDDSKVGKSIDEAIPDLNSKYNIAANIKVGNPTSFVAKDPYTNLTSYFTFVPITIGKSETPWSLAVSVPFSQLKSEAQHIVFISVIIGLIGLMVIGLIIFLIASNITKPLKKTTEVLRHLARGEINASEKLDIQSGDEIEEMAQSVNTLVEGLNRTAEFAKTIGDGNLEAEFIKSGENDVLGNSLLEMRHSLKIAAEEEQKRKIEDEKQNWATQGLAKFGDILRLHNQDIKQLSFNIMSNLVDYVHANQGGLFILNDNDESDTFYELLGAIAYDRQKVIDSSFRLGEGLVGRCAYEKLTIYMEEVPESYVNITSGLGESNPRSILLVPAILNDEVYGIIELASFQKIEDYQIAFIEKIGESIASTIANAKVSERTNKLLDQSKHQSEELAAQEEEMRQNLEELQATQEEINRLRTEDMNRNEKLIDEIEKHRKTLLKILDYVPDKVFLKDADGKMLIVNKTVLRVHNMRPEDIIGKSDFDFIEDHDEAQKLWDAEQVIIHSGKVLHEIQEETINDSGVVLDSRKIPFYIDYLDQTGILGVQTDITQIVDLENKIKQLTEELEKHKK